VKPASSAPWRRRSRHGAPVRMRRKMSLTVCRLSNAGRLLRPRSGGRRGSSKRVGRPSVILDASGYRPRRSPGRLGLAAVALRTGNTALPRVL
jgi:hypothetical protein